MGILIALSIADYGCNALTVDISESKPVSPSIFCGNLSFCDDGGSMKLSVFGS